MQFFVCGVFTYNLNIISIWDLFRKVAKINILTIESSCQLDYLSCSGQRNHANQWKSVSNHYCTYSTNMARNVMCTSTQRNNFQIKITHLPIEESIFHLINKILKLGTPHFVPYIIIIINIMINFDRSLYKS